MRSYNRSQFLSDSIAGVVVGIVALPLAIAFAIASGVTPDRGLWTVGRDKLFGNLDDPLAYTRELLGLPAERAPLGTEPTVTRERTEPLNDGAL
jgi:hypothetical protein